MVGVVFEPCVAHPLHLRVGVEVPGHSQGVLAVPLHAKRQRLDPLQQLKGVERAERGAGVAQRHGARTADVRGRPERLVVHHTVVARLGLVEVCVAIRMFRPGELS